MPAAPSSLAGATGNDQFDLTWSAPADGGSPITGYVLTLTVDGTSQAPVDLTATTYSYSITVTGGTTVSASLAAINAVGTGSAAAVGPFTELDPPAAPSSVLATASNGGATVSWQAPTTDGGSPVTGYTIVATAAGQPTVTAAVAAGSTSAPLSGLVDGTTYQVVVSASNATGTGPSSQPVAVVPVGPPGAPTALSASAVTTEVVATWQPPGDDGGSPITGYVASLVQGGQTVAIQQLPLSQTSATFTGEPLGVPTTVSVVAVNAVGAGPAASSDPVTPGATVPVAPGQPTGVVATAGDRQAIVSWTAPALVAGVDEVGLTPYAGGVALPTQWLPATPSTTTATATGLTDGTTYTFTVTLASASGDGPASAPSNAVTPSGVPTAPASATATPGDGFAVVRWGAADGGPVTGYTVTPVVGGTPQPALAVTVGAAQTSAYVGGLTNGTSTTFAVTAASAAGTGPAATTAAVTPAQASGPKPPGMAKPSVTAGDGQVALTWAPPTVPTGAAPVLAYRVTVTVEGQHTPIVAYVPADQLSTVVTGLPNGTKATVTVAAASGAGWGGDSGGIEVWPGLPPAAPTAVTASAQNGKYTLHWTAPTAGSEPTTGYTVTVTVGGQVTTWHPGAAATSQDLGTYTAGTSVTASVSAADQSGTGPAATVTFTA